MASAEPPVWMCHRVSSVFSPESAVAVVSALELSPSAVVPPEEPEPPQATRDSAIASARTKANSFFIGFSSCNLMTLV
jgi:hypothetical protein